MELSPRLRMVADMVPEGTRFADIGTDHAYLPVWLILHGVIDRAIAADLRQGPLDSARETAEKYDLSEKMDFRLCDGLSGIQCDEADTIAIAGMGGETICHILSNAPWTKKEGKLLILQPMSSQENLRQWLLENGYLIVQDSVIREGRTFYNIMLVRAGTEKSMTAGELIAGRQSRDPLRGEYLQYFVEKTQRVLEGQRSAQHRNEDAVAITESLLNELKQMKEEWDTWQR